MITPAGNDKIITTAAIDKMIADHYDHCRDSLSAISKDTANNKPMIDQADRFFNYDRIGESVFLGKNKPKTPDMIFIREDTLYFVEFKSGMIEGIKKKCEVRTEEDECQYVKWDIKLKALEGAFIVLHRLVVKHNEKIPFSDILNLKKSYILVYKNKEEPNVSTGEKRIGNHLSSGKIRFGLDIYKNTFFVEVATYTPDFFITQLKKFNLIHEDPAARGGKADAGI